MKRTFALFLFSCLLAGCAGKPIMTPIATGPGFYHRVVKGETLWGISQHYGTPVDEVVRVNRLPQASRIDTGQLLFIPKDKNQARLEQHSAGSRAFVWPTEGHIVSAYGSRKDGITNKGIHIAAGQGVDVVAAQEGRVSFAQDYVRGFGRMIIIDHPNNFQTVYAHNAQNLVQEGEWVNQNQLIARIGSTGRATQPYLHFEIRKDHKPRNPFHYLP